MNATMPDAMSSALPPGYPAELERRLTLADGRKVFVRPILPDDADLLGTEVRRADPETLYQRFFTPRPSIDPRRLHHLTHLDYRRRSALVAFDETGVGVGVARYEGLEGSTAEIAVTVKNAWRKAGLATLMLEMLEAEARRHGFDKLTAFFLAENRSMARVLEKLGFAPPRIHAGVAEATKSL